MKNKIMKTSSMLCILLLGNILLAVGGQYSATATENIQIPHSDSLPVGPVLKIFMIGRIKPLDVGDDPAFENYTYFTAVRVLSITTYRYGMSHYGTLAHYRNVALFIEKNQYQFQGILRERFICGVFKYTVV
jgi:hypothetical protein